MKKTKLKYRFHNPNTPEQTAEFLLKVLVQANRKRVDRALQEQIDLHNSIQEESRYAS